MNWSYTYYCPWPEGFKNSSIHHFYLRQHAYQKYFEWGKRSKENHMIHFWLTLYWVYIQSYHQRVTKMVSGNGFINMASGKAWFGAENLKEVLDMVNQTSHLSGPKFSFLTFVLRLIYYAFAPHLRLTHPRPNHHKGDVSLSVADRYSWPQKLSHSACKWQLHSDEKWIDELQVPNDKARRAKNAHEKSHITKIPNPIYNVIIVTNYHGARVSNLRIMIN